MMSGYDFLKSRVLKCWQKVDSDWDVAMSSSAECSRHGVQRPCKPGWLPDESLIFHIGADIILHGGSYVAPADNWWPAECNVRRPGRSTTGTSTAAHIHAVISKEVSTMIYQVSKYVSELIVWQTNAEVSRQLTVGRRRPVWNKSSESVSVRWTYRPVDGTAEDVLWRSWRLLPRPRTRATVDDRSPSPPLSSRNSCRQTHTASVSTNVKGYSRLGNPPQSYGASPAIWDHTVLPAPWHRWTPPH